MEKAASPCILTGVCWDFSSGVWDGTSSLGLIMCCVILTHLYMLKQPCVPGLIPLWSWWMAFLLFLKFCWQEFYWEVFCLDSSRKLVLSSPFPVVSWSGFGSRVMLALCLSMFICFYFKEHSWLSLFPFPLMQHSYKYLLQCWHGDGNYPSFCHSPQDLK